MKKSKDKQKYIKYSNCPTTLILMWRVLIFLMKLVKYKITLINQMKNKTKQNKTNWKANFQKIYWITLFLNHQNTSGILLKKHWKPYKNGDIW